MAADLSAFSPKPPASPYRPPPDEGLDVVAVDPAFVVVNKPAGLLSVPGRGEGKEDCLAARVAARFAEARIVHRLDMGTSGLLVLALGAEMHRLLSAAFMARQVSKRYLALAAGKAPAEGEIRLPLMTDWPNRPRQTVDFTLGKPALTRFRRLGHDPATDVSRLELAPVTGRSHQLRVHLAHIGHPILGDDLYGKEDACPAPRLMLHASELAFIHPLTGQPCHFVAPTPF